MTELHESLQQTLSRWRRHLHRHPELSFKEYETTTYIIDELKKMPGVEVEYGVDKVGLPTGVVATLGTGEGPVIGLRADIDALPIQEVSTSPYRSCHDGVMHACGHDGHTAMLLGAASLLAKINKQTSHSGKIKFIFQPAEETEDEHGKSGAQYMIEAGVLNDIDAILALHLDPELEVGYARLCEGLAMANVDTFSVLIRGTGGHGAYPNQTTDPIWLTAMTLPALYSLTNRRLSPLEPSVLSLGMIQGGQSTNVIPDSVTIKGTMRTYSPIARKRLEEELRNTLKVLETLGGEAIVSIHKGEPALYNDPRITTVLKNTIKKQHPKMNIIDERYGMGGEDFSHMTQKVPGAMLFLGAKSHKVPNCSLHQPSFDFAEESLEIGTQILVHTVLDLFKKGG